ncbi:hypothetical protein ACQI4L_08975 [Mycolicibacterium litorale]|uniref:hypothetical protein n=1 Tax=Mycolicibacterium litorale TaxID=758802 RepID=UPI003CEA6631
MGEVDARDARRSKVQRCVGITGVGLLVLVAVFAVIGTLTNDRGDRQAEPSTLETAPPPTSRYTPPPPTDVSIGGQILKDDGVYRDAGVGVWESNGARADGERCSWMRLDSTEPVISNAVDAGGADYLETIRVRTEATDVAFWTQGCQPWRRVAE